ncbi:MAG: bifunctional serine/threonine-protein kinase/formylglycine-generating enzyme family protein [Nannocystaceae bacterium]
MSMEDPLNLVGTTVADKYDVESVVGEGGFSVVYRAMHRIWGQPVALKCFTALSRAPERLRDALLESFVREGKLMAQLSSETAAIVQARDTGSLSLPDGRWIPYLVLEWLDGRPLSEMMDREHDAGRPARDLRGSLELLAGPIDALARAHERGIAHLDVKPDNLFVCDDGLRTKILDFGVAKLMDENTVAAADPAEAEIASCTPTYAAPEQFNPKRGPTGPHTDVYALALVLVELLRGGEPAVDGSVEELAALSQDPDVRPTPGALGIKVSDDVERVFARALKVEPTDRFPTIGAFYAAICAAVDLDASALPPVRNRPHTGPARFGRPDTLRPTVDTASPSLSPERFTASLDQTGMSGVHQTGSVGSVSEGAVSESRPRESSSPVARAPGHEVRGDMDIVDDEVSVLASSRSRRFLVIGGLAGVVAGAALILGGRGSAGDEDVMASMTSADRSVRSSTTGHGEAEVVATPPPPSPCPQGMSFVEGGKFFMGSDSEQGVLTAARPAHQVEINPFCLDIYEVNVGEYRACSTRGECKRAFRDSFWPRGSMDMDDWKHARKANSKLCNENFADRDSHPINCVTWQQADAFCRFIDKRLPFESEWEFAARGSDGRVYPWGDAVPDHLHMNGCGAECRERRSREALSETPVLHEQDDGFPGTAPVGHFVAGKTAHGLFDMIGNVFEWTSDEFVLYGKRKKTKRKSGRRVIRGGAFNSFMATFADPALRFGMDADVHSHGIGFRCAAVPRFLPKSLASKASTQKSDTSGAQVTPPAG